jgi:hypothetical protein
MMYVTNFAYVLVEVLMAPGKGDGSIDVVIVILKRVFVD